MKTAMQIAFEEIERTISIKSKQENKSEFDKGYLTANEEALEMLRYFLPKEREQIESAYNSGVKNYLNVVDFNAKDYYETTFKK